MSRSQSQQNTTSRRDDGMKETESTSKDKEVRESQQEQQCDDKLGVGKKDVSKSTTADEGNDESVKRDKRKSDVLVDSEEEEEEEEEEDNDDDDEERTPRRGRPRKRNK
mmetsp:Transcript_7360/g.9366  ORF Transcript_7360/g.9366 Transcript_7360/m.9366 type:complete len:109 (-) Transcript_7360:94-420(-)